MGNKTSVNFGCVSAATDDGEYGEYSSVNTRSKSSRSKSSTKRSIKHDHELSANSTISTTSTTSATSTSDSALTPPAPYHDDIDTDSMDSEHYQYYKMNVKILFLDVDGVLNNQYTKWDDYNNGIDDKLLKYLKLILLKTKCKIVLSTTWRLNENAKKLLIHTMKTHADINTDDIIIGQTKNFKSMGKHRTNEIYDYLKRNEYRFNVISWCALDDLSLNKYDEFSHKFMNGHFVKTNPKIGISPQNALQCIHTLNVNDHATNSYHYHQQNAYHQNSHYYQQNSYYHQQYPYQYIN